MEELFEKADEEFLRFERIPEEERLHARPDLCAFLYLHKLFGGTGDMIDGAAHEEIWLSIEPHDIENLTEADVIYLSRCGVRYDSEFDSLCMFV